MHVVVDAVVVRTGSVTIVLEHLLQAWARRFPDDRISVLFGPDGPSFTLPPGADAITLSQPSGPLGGIWLRSMAVRRAVDKLDADAVLAAVPATGLAGFGRPRGTILYDLRFELRPDQFSRRTRIARRVSWGWTLRLSDRIFCISDRTLEDLRTHHPRLARHASTALLGSDHALGWRSADAASTHEAPYAIAFGHYANKNVSAVLAGWASFCRTDEHWRLRLVGMSERDRASAAEQVRALGIADRVDLMPWLDDSAFERCFARAGLVLFPSDFEGFGLPAAEALRLGIPAVISTDPALAEVTGGHAVTAAANTPAALAEAIAAALALTPEELRAGTEFAEAFTWERTADLIRSGLSTC